MKIKIRPDDTSMVQDDDRLQMDSWLAGLRDDGRADDRHAQPARGSDPWPEVLAEAAARAEAAACAEVTVRAVIGDQLQMPVTWCEMGSCISWHADPAALGEAAVHGGGTVAAWGGGRDPGRAVGGYLPVGLPEPGWHR